MDKSIRLYLAKNLNKKQYEVTIRNFPTCTCLDFVAMMFSLLGWQGKWVPCKHMYYVLWAIRKFHPLSNLELWWSLLLVDSWCNYCVGRSTFVNCSKKQVQLTLAILALVMMLCVWLLDYNLQMMLALWFYKCFENCSFNILHTWMMFHC
jgi:hypothetical protein